MKNDKILIANKFNMDDIINPFLSLYTNWVMKKKQIKSEINEFEDILINFIFDYKNNVAMHYFHNKNIVFVDLLNLIELLENEKEWYMQYCDFKLLNEMAFFTHKMENSYKNYQYKNDITLFIVRLLIRSEVISSEVHFNLIKIWSNDRELSKLVEEKKVKEIDENNLIKYNNLVELHKLLSCDLPIETLVAKTYKILEVLNNNLESDNDNILEIYSDYRYLYSSFDEFFTYKKELKDNDLIKNLLVDISHFRQIIELVIKYENKEEIS